MALLRHAVLLIALVCQANVAQASPVPFDAGSTRAGAWRALERCERSRAPYWAAQLERVNPAQALLYKLAWLEAPSGANSLNAQGAVAPGTLAWKFGPEIWTDEEALSPARCATQGEKVVKTFGQLPRGVTQSLLEPKLATYASQPAAVRHTLRDFALFEWLQGRKLALPAALLTSDTSPQESCDWRALKALHATPENSDSLLETARECMPERSAIRPPSALLWAITQTRAGDVFLKSGRTEQAFVAFGAAVGLMPENEMPRALYYRLAVSGMLSGAADEVVLRAAHAAIAADEQTLRPALPAPLRSSLGNLVCERLSVLSTRNAVSMLNQVFKRDKLIPGVLQLTETCAHSLSLSPLWSALLPHARAAADQSKIWGRLLVGALARNDQPASGKAAQGLAVLARKTPYVASRTFWTSLDQVSSSRPMASLTNVIARYRRSGAWLPSDELRLKRLTHKDSQAAARDKTTLLANRQSDPRAVLLPMAMLAEPLVIRGEVPADFTARAKSELFR